MRIDEARDAERLLFQAVQKLQADLQEHHPDETVQSSLDRVELFAFDLQRRVDTAAAAAELCKGRPTTGQQCDALRQLSNRWLDYVQSARHASAAEQVSRLAELLKASASYPMR